MEYFEAMETEVKKHLKVDRLEYIFTDEDSNGNKTKRFRSNELTIDIFDLNYVCVYNQDETIDYDIYL